MIFDWQNDKETALANGIEETVLFSVPHIKMKGSVISGHTFRNFPSLEFEDGTKIENCIFEDCGRMHIDECVVENCTFQRFHCIFFYYSTAVQCTFCQLICNTDLLLSLEGTTLTQCRFDDVQLNNDSYLCDGTNTSWIEKCSFSRIASTREDGEIIICEESVGFIFKRKKQFCIVDEDSCTGLNQVTRLA